MKSGTIAIRIDDVKLTGTSAPTLTTPTVADITATTATLGATVTANGGSALTSRGTVWGTAASPTLNALAEGGTAVSAFTQSRSGFSPNTLYYFRGYAENTAGTGYSPDGSFYTLANVPAAPTVNNPSTSTLDVTLGSGDGNPAGTEYAIHETSTDQYVQAGGSLGASAVWQTSATWSTRTVTGLTPATAYTFEVKARNGANTETGFGTSATASTAAATTPTINVTGGPLAFGNVEQNATSELSVTVSGSALTADITVSAPSGFEISTTSGSGFSTTPITLTPSGGSVAATPIYVRFQPTAVQAYSGNLTCTSTGATDKTVALSGTGVYSSSSDIVADTGFTYPQNIAYASYQETDLTGSSLAVAQFVLRDGGASADADSAGTTLTALSFTVANFANLRRVALYDGTTELAEADAAATVSFSGLSVTADDGATRTLTLRASFQQTVTDNQQFSFTVSSATASAAGSGFAAANAGGAASSTAGDNNRLEVTATALVFSSAPPASVNVGQNFSLTVQARDANQNLDLDSTASVTLSKASGNGTLSSAAGLTQSLVSGAKAWSDVQISASGTFTIQAAASGLSSVTSGSITATSLLLVEDFDYPAGDSITAHGWTAHSSAGSNPIKVTSPGLTFCGYPSSGVGNAVTMTTSGEDDNKTFTAKSSGSVYAAFLVKASAATASGDYFFHFGSVSYIGRVFLKQNGSQLAFGVSKGATASSAAYTGYNYALNTTYLVVLKYTFNASSADTVSLFVNPSPGTAEPSPTIASTDSATDATSIDRVALRQDSASSVTIDGIRVGPIWADVVGGCANQYEVTGGGTYCSGTAGVAIGLANSDSGVSYQLYRNNGGSSVAVGSPVAGSTGNAITFGTQQYPADTYTVAATPTCGTCSATMNGSAVVVVNTSPSGTSDVLSTPKNTAITFSAAKLLANDAGSDKKITAVTPGAGANHGTLSTTTADGAVTSVTYTPKPDYAGADDFNYTLANSSGCSVQVTVNVTVGSGRDAGANIVFTGTDEANQFIARFAAIPGETYTVEYSDELPPTDHWTKLGTANYLAPGPGDPHPYGIGVFQITDPAHSASRYYRTVWPAY